ncbi:B12-binding domain-containing radical SAM protein, partial [Candidatus Bathyarchaeota archaeon]|nr:B12-binding domain-containing radical SAM protein [Candidatus Bathyarchaeota archaeon]NIV67967.1 B12-binding domain-containing radical SAM protein [Candidatus Bathyarchaeota archaeon]NIW34514.1 B12-binding domain-containing radical SAM protein [Candidatus Bathyarchaeota archaeon]
YHTAKVVKNHNPAILVVVGGAHVTFQDKQVLRECPEIDVVVRGEGEVTMSV